jgi:DinB superfamily
MGFEPLLQHTDAGLARPLAGALLTARADVSEAVDALREIADADLTRPWVWKGGSKDEIRYGFYRIGERFELAGIDAEAALRSNRRERGRAGDLIAPATAARWDLHGLLLPLPAAAWDADPGGGEWTVRQTLGHVIASQRAYGVGTAWWQERSYAADDPGLPAAIPGAVWEALPTEQAEVEATLAEVRDRLDQVLDRSAERLAGLPPDRLIVGARWSGFVVDVAFRLGRWSSHLREHTVQVEKTLVTLDHRPTEVDRLVRLVLAAWGRAEAVVYGHADPDAAIALLAASATDARATAAEIAHLARA